ncbi:MAG TPA: glycosyltransferase [Chitinophagaceae bacterium]
MIIIYLILFLFACYSVLVLYYAKTWNSVPFFTPPSTIRSLQKISVIIPARNEERNIGTLLRAIENQSYPRHLFEVIVIDDHSTDSTAEMAQGFPLVRLLQLKESGINSYKKKAIETGIAAATGDLIITTDADCHPLPHWLATHAAFKEEKKAVFVTAPVVIECNSTILQLFQAMDFMVLQGITGAAVHSQHLSMCNGANLCYERKAFYDVGGFAGIDAIASGDDMLLMHKINAGFPGKSHFLKSTSAIVSTRPATSWGEFFNQRIRWASKAAKYDDKRLLPVLLLVYLVNVSFLVLAVLGFWNTQYWLWLLAAWIIKTVVELPLFMSVASFFNKKWAAKYFFLFQPLHIIYTIISGLFGQLGRYEWKGRKVK